MQVYNREITSLANFNLESQKSQQWSIPAGQAPQIADCQVMQGSHLAITRQLDAAQCQQMSR